MMGSLASKGWNTSCTSRASSGWPNSERRACSQSPAPGARARARQQGRLRRQACAKIQRMAGNARLANSPSGKRPRASTPAQAGLSARYRPRAYTNGAPSSVRRTSRASAGARQRSAPARRPCPARPARRPAPALPRQTAGRWRSGVRVSEAVSPQPARPGRRHIFSSRRQRSIQQTVNQREVLLLALRGRCRRAPLPASGAPVY